MRDTPTGWTNVQLREVCEINPRVDKTSIASESPVTFVPMSAVEAGTGMIDVSDARRFEDVRTGYTPFRKGDVLFAKITPCMENGKMAVVPDLVSEYGFGSTEFHVLRPADGVDPRFLYHAVSSLAFRHHAEHNMTGAVGQRRVPAAVLEEHEVGMPPTEEQRRVVVRIEALFDQIDRGVENLCNAKRFIDLYRRSLLKAAFEGRLTAQWRTKNQSRLESAHVLLERFRRQRQDYYEAAFIEWEQAIDKWHEEGSKGKKPSKPRRPRPMSATSTDLSVPGWAIAPLGLLVADPIYGTPKKCGYGAGATGVLRIPNIGSGRLDLTDLKSADFDDADSAKFSLQAGDVLTVRSNGSLSVVGKPALVKQEHTDYLFAGYLIRLRPIARSLLPEYLVYGLMEPQVRAQIEDKAKSTSGVNNISAKELQELEVRFCCIEEQAEIVRILDARLEAADTLGHEIDATLARAEALRQSILKRAFLGELVPQDPNDEPAQNLLARIRAATTP